MKTIRRTVALLAAVLAVTILSPSASAEKRIEVPWAELALVLDGRTVSTVLVDGTVLRGRVLDVSADEAHIEVKKTSNRALYPKGDASVPRNQLSAFSYTERKGKWRAIGTAIGASGGAVAMLPLAMIANNESHSRGEAELAVGAAIGAGLGYVGGLAADTHTTTVLIAKE